MTNPGPAYDPPTQPGWDPPATPTKPSFLRRRWVQITAAAVIGLGVGGIGAGTDASKARDEAAAATARAAAATSRADTADSTVATVRTDSSAAIAKAKTDAEASVASRLAEADKIKADATAAAAETTSDAAAQAKAVTDAAAAAKADADARIAKATGAEATAAANEFAGDGIYRVPEDVKPGTYKADASSGCYYARLSSLAGSGTDNIIDNNNVDGPVVLTVRASDKGLEVARCATFHKVG